MKSIYSSAKIISCYLRRESSKIRKKNTFVQHINHKIYGRSTDSSNINYAFLLFYNR